MRKENQKDICPFRMSEVFKYDISSDIHITEEDGAVIVEILKHLGNYRIKSALQMLDYAKSALLECTLVHEEYQP